MLHGAIHPPTTVLLPSLASPPHLHHHLYLLRHALQSLCKQGDGDDADDPPAGGADAAAEAGDAPAPQQQQRDAAAAPQGDAGADDPPAVDGAADHPHHGGGNPGPGVDGGADPHPQQQQQQQGAGGAAGDDDEPPAADAEFTTHPDGSVSEVLHVPRTQVGKLIGKSGATIMGLQSSTGCSIQVDQQTLSRGGECRRVTLRGAPAAVRAAKAAVRGALAAEAAGPAPGAGEVSEDVACPQGVVGRVIGRAGETIRLLQGASGAYILVNQNFPDGVDRVVTATGSADAVRRAVAMVRALIADEAVGVQAVIAQHGLGKTVTLQCPRAVVGRVIGRGGETVKALQRRYAASVQIDQTTDPMTVTVVAAPHDADACRAEILAIMANPDHAMAAMGGGGGGMRMMGPRPGMGGGAYGGGMAMMAAPYGGAPYGAYGGAGGYGAGAYNPAAAAMMAAAAAAYGGGYGAAAPYGAAPAYGGAAGGGYDASAYGGGAAAPAAGGGAQAGGGSAWQAIADDQGRTYYYNALTGVSQWERPADMA